MSSPSSPRLRAENRTFGAMPLTEAQVQRYSRHILLPEVGGGGQERLLGASAAVAFSPEGGGAAAVAAVYLASAGVGRIGWAVARDVRNGLVSPDAARRHYGVAVNADCTIDEAETARLRASAD